jgi:hypothetical protein
MALDMKDNKVRKAFVRISRGDCDLKDKSPEQFIGIMWELTLNSWSFKEMLNAEPRLQRDIIVLKRRSK